MPVRFESTPNPQTFLFSAGQPLSDRSIEFLSAKDAQFAPLPKKLFGFPWCSGVFVGKDFITVTKQEWVDWEIIAEPLAHLIEEHLESGQPVLSPPPSANSVARENPSHDSSESMDTAESASNDSPTVGAIKRILNDEIRPMVAQDGGDVVFVRYENSVVYVHMRGSCAGCPSSTMTLKMGIEARLKNAIPEISSVEAI